MPTRGMMVGQGESDTQLSAWVTLACATGFEGRSVGRGTGLMDRVEDVYCFATLCVKGIHVVRKEREGKSLLRVIDIGCLTQR